ncbi:DNA polymerase-3 subunit alpha (Gram-positive type) [Desulfohalotomaculum tongense]|uniref:PolC-type DNA polymerase III n=1 Tax=Desulforadius tongensis TaxID=1216062 RepID=UPI001EE50C10|nr:PolC-type DNA polymerase III [Desulforadius tongensis]MBM7854434.1 DNA polymerase-3 subunit alpha (Gram-positive type) [Desulforadius tongensis]
MSKGLERLRELLPETTVTKVQVDTKASGWQIYLYSENPLSKEMLARAEEYFYNAVPELKKVELIPVKKLTEEEMVQKLPQLWPRIVADITAQVPAVNGWLESAEYKYMSGTLTVTIKNSLGLKLLQDRSCSRLLAEKLCAYTGCRPQIELECGGNGREVSPPVWQAEAEQQFIKKLKESSCQRGKVSKGDNEDKWAPGDTGVFIGRKINDSPVPLSSLQDEEKQVVACGRVFGSEMRELRSGRYLLTFNITDKSDSIAVKIFLEKEKIEAVSGIKDGCWVKVRGPVQHDKYSQELTIMAYDINSAPAPERRDNAREKRVELHLHTQMSAMDSVLSVSTAIKQAAKWGHPAVAITDHGVVQAYPEAYSAAEKNGIKVIYGMEGYLIDDGVPVVENPPEVDITAAEFVVFDLETTGLHPRTDEIIEIGAVKMRGLEVVDNFSTMVRPSKPIPSEIIKLTGITDDMVRDAPGAREALAEFRKFIGKAVLVAHNASFDVGFIRIHLANQLNVVLDNPVLDTMTLARTLHPKLKNHKLNTLCKEFNVSLENHHRAVDDAAATAALLNIFLQQCADRGMKKVSELNNLTGSGNLEKLRSNHVTILAQNQVGLKNLYKLITYSHLKYYYRHPRIPKSLLVSYREGLLIGSACEAGELFRAIMSGAPEEKIEKIASFYDYLEIQPLGNSRFLVDSGQLKDIEQLKQIYKSIYRLGKKLGKPVVATGDVHFLDPEDEVYRRILMAGKGFEDADNQPPLYFKTTDEMLSDFSYLGEEAAYEVVVANTRRIADQIDKLLPIPKETYPPEIEGAEQQITDMSEERAKELYGDPLPKVVRKRLDKELKSIIGNGFAVLYLIAHKLVKKSNEDGYLVGSRGSVGSSLVATLTGITEVNPLPAHYRCTKCKYSEFIEDGSYACGADMPDKDCPRCGSKLVKDGQDIPFEVFLGFEGDKVPDIDLNFSGEYQSRAQKYTEVLFGKDNVFKAGTIGTIAEKTAYGFVKKYLDERNIVKREAEINRLVTGCTGVKRTTGQHPGGIMVVPKNVDVHDVTPLQHPADDKSSGIITTHFDYHAIHDCLVKLDILGHDDPTVIKMLEDLTGVDAKTIPLDDKDTLSLFSGTEALGVTPEQIRSPVATYAIPEFGTKFVRQMLVDTKPTTFSELVRISGFSHGTDVWLNNAQDLIKSGTCQLSEAISARDDIMIYLIHKGLPPKKAFKIMEKVRKGKGVTEEEADLMREHDVPEWYIESCRKIKYMFPKAHAVAYVMMAFRIAWFKVNYPEAFYATYFTVRADDFDADLIVRGHQAVLRAIEEIEEKGVAASPKEKNLLTILEVALEMYARGYSFKKVSLSESDATKFLIVGKQLLPPLGSLQGVGESAARSIVKAREEAPFTSIEDLRIRAKVSKTVIETLQQHGCLEGMEETNQLSLF